MRPRKLVTILFALNVLRIARSAVLIGAVLGVNAMMRPKPIPAVDTMMAADTTPPVPTADPMPVYVPPAVSAPLPEPRTVEGLLEGVKMYGAIGWGQRTLPGHTSLVRTTDGGATWTNAGPRMATEEACGFTSRSENEAWILACQKGEDIHDILSGTRDGGATWTHQEISTDLVDLGTIDFQDATHATLVLWPRTYAEGIDMSSILFRSTDGGRTWSEISRPGGETITFSDPMHAFVRGDQDGHAGTLRFSTDGGKTFAEHPALRACAIDADPVFSGPQRGVLVGRCPAGAFAFQTRDAGVTWTPGARIDRDELPVVTFGDPDHGILVDALGTLATSDGGVTWTPGDPTMGTGIGLDPRRGRAFAMVSSSDSSSQIVSADAGKGWHAVITVPKYGTVEFVFSGATDMLAIARSSEASLVYRSRDGGKSFEVLDRR